MLVTSWWILEWEMFASVLFSALHLTDGLAQPLAIWQPNSGRESAYSDAGGTKKDTDGRIAQGRHRLREQQQGNKEVTQHYCRESEKEKKKQKFYTRLMMAMILSLSCITSGLLKQQLFGMLSAAKCTEWEHLNQQVKNHENILKIWQKDHPKIIKDHLK